MRHPPNTPGANTAPRAPGSLTFQRDKGGGRRKRAGVREAKNEEGFLTALRFVRNDGAGACRCGDGALIEVP